MKTLVGRWHRDGWTGDDTFVSDCGSRLTEPVRGSWFLDGEPVDLGSLRLVDLDEIERGVKDRVRARLERALGL